MTERKTKPTEIKPKKILVVFGCDEDGKPRAAKFEEKDFELARKAANLMKLEVYEGDASKLRRTLKKVAQGNIYASGWGFVPHVRWTQYDALVTKLSGRKPPKPGALSATGYPTSWDAIEVGHCVLAQGDTADSGWWEAIVVAIEGDMLSLQLRDYPKEKGKRHRTAVALLNPPSAPSV